MTKILPYTFGVEIECFGVPVQVVTWVLAKNGIAVADLLSPPPSDDVGSYNQARQGRYGSTHWVISGDGSIRGNHPMEIKSPILQGAEGIKALRKVVTILRQTGLKVNESTGLHVHVGVKNAPGEHSHNAKTVLEVLRRYDTFNADIEKLIRSDRRGVSNTYCRPIKQRVTVLEAALNDAVFTAEPMPEGHELWSATRREEYRRYGAGDWYWESDGRHHTIPETPAIRRAAGLRAAPASLDNLHTYGHHYDACSIAALGKYGTIEFRQHQGSMNPAEIVNWVLFVLNHVEQARLTVEKQGKPGVRGRKPGLFTGLPMSVRTHFKKQIEKFGPRPPRAAVPRVTAAQAVDAAANRAAAAMAGQLVQDLPPAF